MPGHLFGGTISVHDYQFKHSGRLALMASTMEGNENWTLFLAAAAGATSALTGLVFVALSINLDRILKLPGVAARAGETLLILATGLIGSLVALIPNLKSKQLGIAFLVLWAPTWGIPMAIQIRSVVRKRYHRPNFAVWGLVLHQITSLPLMFAGLSLCGYFRGGLIWFAATLILGLIVALNNAWVLLVEILR